MTREETITLFKSIVAAYPQFNPSDKKAAIELWSKSLQNDSFEDVMSRFEEYVANNKFAPTIADLKKPIKRNEFVNFNQRNYSKEFWKGLER